LNNMLRLIDISKSYDHITYAVEELSLIVEDGHILVMLGHNGAGKTTTLRIVSTVLAQTSGLIFIDGIDISQADTDRLRMIKRKIGFVAETTNLLGCLTPWEYLFYLGQMYGIKDEKLLRHRIDELVARFGITDSEVKYIEDYSSGLKKRISIASVMINTPSLLLLDEPTAHLDPIGVKVFKEYLKELRSTGVTILLATHQLDIAKELADEILIINEGENIFHGTLDDVCRRFRDVSGNANLEKFYSELIVE